MFGVCPVEHRLLHSSRSTSVGCVVSALALDASTHPSVILPSVTFLVRLLAWREPECRVQQLLVRPPCARVDRRQQLAWRPALAHC
jgi:hypothetical protein